MLLHEKEQFRAYEIAYAELYKDKFEFYTQGPTKEQAKQENIKWKDTISLPSRGLSSSRKEVDMYIASDKDIVKLNIKIGDQKEKVELLESIIGMIKNRSFHIQSIIDWERFKNGD